MALVSVYFLFFPVQLIDAQREIFSLGSKLKKRFDEASQDLFHNDRAIVREQQDPIFESIDLSFQNVTLTLQNGKTEPRVLLDNIRGRAQPGRLLGIMGPSGAGKSSLLHALAGKIKDNSKLSLTGIRYVNGLPVDPTSPVPAAFIEQEVNFFPHMTVRETLNFRVQLKLNVKGEERDKIVNDLLEQLSLTKTADTIVGDNKVRGISGGERKRLSIAVEMISSPNLIFLDEPTSGLDSTAATSLVETLRQLANQGKTVIAVIHQPPQHVFSKFDDILLLNDGKLMFFGERDKVRQFMDENAVKAALDMGTAEHIIDCVTPLPIYDESMDEVNSRIERIENIAQAMEIDFGEVKEEGKNHALFKLHKQQVPRSSIFRQFRLLFTRSLAEVFRGKATLIIKTVQQVTIGLIYGGIYNLDFSQASIQDRFGLLSLIAIGSANSAIASTIRSFPKEKAIVASELAAKMYRTLPYFIGKALSELPLVALFNGLFASLVYKLTGLSNAPGKFQKFLGLLCTHGLASEAVGLLISAISPSSDFALALFPALLVLNIIFDGRNISAEGIPRFLRWIPKVSLIRWGFEGLSLNEFDGLVFETGGPRRGPVAKTGLDALARFGLGGSTLGDVVRAQLTITGVCWLLSFLGLTLTKQKYLPMQAPDF